MSSPVFASCLAAVLALSATTHQPLSPQQPSTVTDSAGVLIVETTSPAWPSGTGWRLATDPTLTIGDESGDLNYMFEGVSQAFRLDDGTIVVVDRLASQISLFDPAGVFIRDLGGRGEGPGEFQILHYVWARGDTVWASDGLLSRVSVFDRNGDVLEDHSGGGGAGHGWCDRRDTVRRRSAPGVERAVRRRTPGLRRRHRRRCLDAQPVLPRAAGS